MRFTLATGYRRSLNLSTVLLLVLAFVPPINAQETSPSPLVPDDSVAIDKNETVRIETDLVDLNVTVFSRDPAQLVGKLEQKDFCIFEDDVEQGISLFASAETPFDLVLLIDLSGSTRDKLNLIRKSATGFVDATRPIDRVAIITFTDGLKVVSPLTFDREDLRKRIKNMEKPNGGTNFWDAARYVIETMLNPARTSRRSAVVMMTDGVDNALPDVPGEGSRTGFDELLGMVRNSDTILIPIYLDTERETLKNHKFYSPAAYEVARQQLGLLATESGSMVYFARKVEDLKDTYQQVIRDLSLVYSVGYRPINGSRDGSWRAIKVQLVGRPDLAARSRHGYFAK